MTVFDAHCDTLWRCEREGRYLFRENPDGHWDIARAKQFTNCAQIFAIFADAKGKSAVQMRLHFQTQYAIFMHELAANAADIRHCCKATQVEESFKEGRIAALLSVEGADLLGCSAEGLELAHTYGVRAVNVTWNRANALSGAVIEDAQCGLSNQGREFVRRMQSLDMLVDVSHLSDAGFWDVIRQAKAPILASHSNARALCAQPRNLSDEQIHALFDNGGVMGLNFYAGFLGADPDFDSVRAQIDHILNLGGEHHLALGGDWDGCDALPRGMEAGVSSLLSLYEYLKQKQYPQTLLDQLYYKNLMKVVGFPCTM